MRRIRVLGKRDSWGRMVEMRVWEGGYEDHTASMRAFSDMRNENITILIQAI